MTLPFNGAITDYFENEAPDAVRDAIRAVPKGAILSDAYPYAERLNKGEYKDTLYALQLELAKLLADVKTQGKRIIVVFEGRDAAGKGGTIKRFMEPLNPRGATVVALTKPTEKERGQWYFQRYIRHLPSDGEIVLFDRSWYNRAVVERVMGFCSNEQYDEFMRQAPAFERMLVRDGITLIKFWFSVSRKEQIARFTIRRIDPVRQWKLSPMDLASLDRWDTYTDAKEAMFYYPDTPHAPWTVVRSNDKKRGRIEAMRFLLDQLPYDEKDESVVGTPDPHIVGPPHEIYEFGEATGREFPALEP